MVSILVGCSSDGEERPEYMDAITLESLEVPPRLSIPDTREALHLPEPSAKVKSPQMSAQTQMSPQTSTVSSRVIAPNFRGFELKNDSRLYWLVIDKPVADVWAILPKFLASEGIEVDRVEKLQGFVDTSWMDEYQITYGSDDGTGSLFSGFSADYKDRFRLRVEAIPNTNKSRLFVAHRGLQISVAEDVSEWVQRDSEPLLEREILYRFILFNGIKETQAMNLLAAYNSYQPRVNKITGFTDQFEVKGESDIIWMRLQVAMDRMDVEIVSSDKASRTLNVSVGNITEEIITPEKDDTGWFDGLFSGKDIVVDESEEYEDNDVEQTPTEKRSAKKINNEDKLKLQITQIAGDTSSQIKLSRADGSVLKDKSAWPFLEALLRQMK